MADRLDSAAVLSVVDLIYSAGCEPELWPQVAAACQQLFPRAGFSLLLTDPANNLDAISCGAGYDPCTMQSYVEHYHAINPYLPLIDGLASDEVARASQHVSQEWLKSHQFYHEWLKPAGDYTFGATLPIRSSTGRMLRLTYDIPSDEHETEPVAADLLERTASHFRRAFDVSWRLREAGLAAAFGQSLLDGLSGAAFIVDETGKIVGMSASAVVLLEQGGTFQSNSSNELLLAVPRENDLLQRAIKSVTAISLLSAPSGFPVTLDGSSRPVVVLPLRKPAPILTAQTRRLALVQLVAASSRLAPPLDLLRQLYNLTKAEAVVVQRVTEGYAIKEIADFNETSQSTVRNQLQAAMQKLSVHRQAELVSLVSSITPRLELGD